LAEEPAAFVIGIIPSPKRNRRKSQQEATVAVNRKFTRIPKTTELIAAGVPTEVIPTYCSLADHANNKSGLCYPKMQTLAQILNRSARTIQRHLHLLKDLGLIEFVERRRNKGRFSSYLYKVIHIVQTTGHARPVGSNRSNKRRTKPSRTTPKSPSTSVKDGYHWIFGDDPPTDKQQEHDKQVQEQREEEASRRKEDFEWLFGK
jgi:DNA-binding transcriptional ArsR family regulator